MAEYGYIRISTRDQNEARQIETMQKKGVLKENIFIDKKSGKNMDREQYQTLREKLCEGDLIYLDDLDRLGRNYDLVIEEWKYITRAIKADIVIVSREELFDSRKFKLMGDIGKFLEDQLSLLAYVAEQERKNNRRRQAEGIELAKSAGKYKGRKAKLIPGGEEEVRMNAIIAAYENGVSISDIRKTYRVGNGTIYKLVKEHSEKNGR
ncbi:recombinase family protein (plasmid) [Lysinibacillus capsici]|uniref:recombinase family protein n=1 Tax=Lysinibacillus capsici TaxID=2115968 RepID=UPI0021DA6AF6|nr:recombinase family protein [Lysinibacillus capsici]UYB50220.1 recombinase family protein [Lysinibacillus capsici]